MEHIVFLHTDVRSSIKASQPLYWHKKKKLVKGDIYDTWKKIIQTSLLRDEKINSYFLVTWVLYCATFVSCFLTIFDSVCNTEAVSFITVMSNHCLYRSIRSVSERQSDACWASERRTQVWRSSFSCATRGTNIQYNGTTVSWSR